MQEALTIPNQKNPERPTPRHTVIKMSQVKDEKKILKASKGTPVRLPAGFSAEMLRARREGHNRGQALKGKHFQP